jgi:hypothetical protein
LAITTPAAWLAVGALQLAGDVDQLTHLRVAVVEPPEVRALGQGVVQRDPQPLRDHLGQQVHLLDGEGQHPADVLDRRARRHRAERGDLGHARLAVLLPDVGDHLLAPVLAEVDVDVRRLRAVRVEEALEQQVVLQRVYVAQLQDVADQRPAGRAAGAARDALLHREAHEVPDDQEVAGEAHPADDAQLVLQPVAHRLGRRLAVALAQAGLAQLPQVRLRGLLRRRREDGEVALLEVQFDVAAVGDLLAAAHGLAVLGEEAVHLLRRPDVELVAAVAQPALVGAGLACVDAQEHVVGGGVGLAQVVGVAGRHQRQAEPVGDGDGTRGALLLDVQAVVLDLDVEVVAEDAVEPAGQLRRLVDLVLEDVLAELARGAAGQADQALLVRFEQLLVDARDVVVALQEGDGGHLDEVLEAGAVAGQQGEVVAGVAAAAGLAVGALAGGDVRLVADDRVEAGRLALAVELDGAVQVAVVGQGQGVHAQLPGPRHQLGHAAGPVEQAVVAVTVQVDEGTVGHTRRFTGAQGRSAASGSPGDAWTPYTRRPAHAASVGAREGAAALPSL